MEHKDVVLENLLLTEPIRTKAKLKYELRNLESNLAQLIKTNKQMLSCSQEIADLCSLLIDKYVDYLHLMDIIISPSFFLSLGKDKSTPWLEHYHLLLRLKKQLSSSTLEEEKNLLMDITSLYFYIKQTYVEALPILESKTKKSDGLYELFISGDLKFWFMGLISLWNQTSTENKLMHVDFQKWTTQQQQYTLDFFASAECVHLINSLFFYKLNPEQLEKNLHPEKLISLQMKIEYLHSYLTLLRQQLYKAADLHEIKPEVDFLCDSNELPPGVKFEIHPSFKNLILDGVKLFKITTKIPANKLINIQLIHDVFAAYKFWFNPSRLIDTVMLLRQTVSDDEAIFYQEMINLYQQLTTTQCLDLYGFFSNRDSRYLLYTLRMVVNQSNLCKWLPILTTKKKDLISRCYSTLQLVMEALRIELKNRTIVTDAYQYELPSKEIEIRTRNRQAVLRIIEIYSAESEHNSSSLDQLFLDIEKSS